MKFVMLLAGPWQAYIEKPDGSVELLESYKQKPALGEVQSMSAKRVSNDTQSTMIDMPRALELVCRQKKITCRGWLILSSEATS